MVTKRDYNESKQSKPMSPPIAFMAIEKVVREHVPIEGGGTSTIGECVQLQLIAMAREHVEVQKIELRFEPEQWFALANSLRSGNDAAYPYEE